MRPHTQNTATCPNPLCSNYHNESGKGIIRKGKSRAGHQEYKCKQCGTRFSETTNTPLHRKRIQDDDVHIICRMALDKNGARSIERMTGHRRETVGRLFTCLAEDPVFSTGYLLGSMKFTSLEVHELVGILSNWLDDHPKAVGKQSEKKGVG